MKGTRSSAVSQGAASDTEPLPEVEQEEATPSVCADPPDAGQAPTPELGPPPSESRGTQSRERDRGASLESPPEPMLEEVRDVFNDAEWRVQQRLAIPAAAATLTDGAVSVRARASAAAASPEGSRTTSGQRVLETRTQNASARSEWNGN